MLPQQTKKVYAAVMTSSQGKGMAWKLIGNWVIIDIVNESWDPEKKNLNGPLA